MYTQANYFAVLPAAVRYNPKLTSRAILLYGLLVSLSCGGGEVFASNKYLADTLNVSERTVNRLLAELEAEKYISIRYEYVNGTKEIARRFIRRNELPMLLYDLPKTADYAVILTHILCNPELSVQAKLLYAEISAATPRDGFCSKSATFFAKILHTSETTVQRYTRELIQADALRVEMEYKGDSKEIRRRRIYLTEAAAIVEKHRQIEQDSQKDGVSSNESGAPNVANTLQESRILGGDKNDTTYITTLAKLDRIYNHPNRRRNKRGKRKKFTQKLLE